MKENEDERIPRKTVRNKIWKLQEENAQLKNVNAKLRSMMRYSKLCFYKSEKVINDPVQGYIPIDDKIVKLIDTEEFQRLRGIKQLGFADKVYPGGLHTRFIHSLGVMQLGRSFLRQIILTCDIEISVEDQEVFLAACLLHDVGHAPFSHVLEDLPEVSNHDILSAEAVMEGEIRAILEEEWCIKPRRIATVIGSKPSSDPSYPEEERQRLENIIGDSSSTDSFFSNVLHSQIGPDKLDYLKRDAYFSGAKHGFYDAERLIDCLRFRSEDECYEMIVTEKGIPLVEHALFSYYEMFRVLYWHHAHRSVTSMAKRAVEDAFRAKKLNRKEILKLTDEQLLSKLEKSGVESSEDLVNRIRCRKLYKRGKTSGMHEKEINSNEYYYRIELFKDTKLRRHSEKKIINFINDKRAGEETIKDHEILIDIPNLPKWKLNIDFKAENPIKGKDPVNFADARISALTKAIENLFETSVWKIRVFCSEDRLRKDVEEYWKEKKSL
ncbi:MAG: HD domain-containing protein [Theionarchaea archaeon]|nr:MAG: hypothetical protein AYK19_04470 [Theionarchaea archaeon DG-70-1]MBU7026569.1 HD domain-containing protein [Theionarchaea archaeon]